MVAAVKPDLFPDPDIWRGQKVGLLGGSFNPAHEGHLHISLEALEQLGLDHIWWLVSPQNPLKSEKGMAAFDDRIKSAENVADHPHIQVMDIERKLGTIYTIDTVTALRSRLPEAHFVWLMGADNLATFTDWKDWKKIMHTLPVAVFDRPGYTERGLTGKVAVQYQKWRYLPDQILNLAMAEPPAWAYISCSPHPQSSTALRNSGAAM